MVATTISCSTLKWLIDEVREKAASYAGGHERPEPPGQDVFGQGIAAGLRLASIEMEKVHRHRCGRR